MSLRTSPLLPLPNSSFAAPVLVSISQKRASGQGFISQTTLSRLEVLRLAAFTALQAALHTVCLGARLVFSATQVALYPVMSQAAPRAELALAGRHAGVALKSATALAITLPAVLRPELAISGYKWLGLYAERSSILQRIADRTKKAWASPYRHQVLLATALTVLGVVGLTYVWRSASAVPTTTPITPKPVNTHSGVIQPTQPLSTLAQDIAAEYGVDEPDTAPLLPEAETVATPLTDVTNESPVDPQAADLPARATTLEPERTTTKPRYLPTFAPLDAIVDPYMEYLESKGPVAEVAGALAFGTVAGLIYIVAKITFTKAKACLRQEQKPSAAKTADKGSIDKGAAQPPSKAPAPSGAKKPHRRKSRRA